MIDMAKITKDERKMRIIAGLLTFITAEYIVHFAQPDYTHKSEESLEGIIRSPSNLSYIYENQLQKDAYNYYSKKNMSAPKKEKLEKEVIKYRQFVQLYAKQYNVPESIIYAIISTESRGNPRARSNKGARGLMQLMPGTANDMGVARRNIYDPKSSIMGGTKYFSDLYDQYENNEVLALAAYNWGPENLDRMLKKRKLAPPNISWIKLRPYVPAETRDYIIEIAGKLGTLESTIASPKARTILPPL